MTKEVEVLCLNVLESKLIIHVNSLRKIFMQNLLLVIESEKRMLERKKIWKNKRTQNDAEKEV